VEKSADEAMCVDVSSISFKSNILQAPYECDPTDNSHKCKLNHQLGYFEVDCDCALDGNTGYCA